MPTLRGVSMKEDETNVTVALLKNDELNETVSHNKNAIVIDVPIRKSAKPIVQKRNAIQGLRAVAIIQVIAFHSSIEGIPNGYVGVDIFFILSGYLITMILSRNVQSTAVQILNFYGKRVKRIFPAYYLTIGVVILAGDVYLFIFDKQTLINTAYWAGTFAMNMRAWYLHSDYFSQLALYNFLLHTWSLSVEIQFYLIAPGIMLISRQVRYGDAIVAPIGLLSFYFYFYCYSEASDSASFIHSRLWQFFLGGIAYRIGKKKTTESSSNFYLSWFWKVLTVVAVGIVVVTPLLPKEYTKEWYRVVISILVAFILTDHWQSFTELFLGNRILVFIGNISYSVYLSHWPVILFFRYLNNNDDALSFLIKVFDSIHLTIFLSIGSYYLVERFFIRSQFIRTILFVIAVLFLTTIIHLCYGDRHERNIERWAMEENITAAYMNALEMLHNASLTKEPMFDVTEDVRRDAIQRNKELTKYMYPEVIRDTESDEVYVQFFGTINTTYRGYKKGKGYNNVLIFGNQFAHRAFDIVEQSVGRNRFREIRLIATKDCLPFLDDATPSKCWQFSKKAVKFIEQIKPHLLFLIFKTGNPLTSPFEDDKLFDDNIYKSMQKTMDRLSAVATRIVITYDIPWTQNSRNLTQQLLARIGGNDTKYNDINLPFRECWKMQQYSIKRLDGIICRNCDRLQPYHWFCAPKYERCRIYHPRTLISYFHSDKFLNIYGMEYVSRYFKDLIDEYFERYYFI